MIRSFFLKYKYCVNCMEDVLKYFKNIMSLVIFFFYFCVEVFLKLIRWVVVLIIVVYCIIVIFLVCVWSIVMDCLFEEIFIVFVCVYFIMFFSGFVFVYGIVEFVFWFNFGKINDGWISIGCYVVLCWKNECMCMDWVLVWKLGE